MDKCSLKVQGTCLCSRVKSRQPASADMHSSRRTADCMRLQAGLAASV